MGLGRGSNLWLKGVSKLPLGLEILKTVHSEIPSPPFAWHRQSYEMIPPRVSSIVSAWLPWALKTRDRTVQKVGKRLTMCLKVPAQVLWFVCGMSPLGLQMVVLFGKVVGTSGGGAWEEGSCFPRASLTHFLSADCDRSNAVGPSALRQTLPPQTEPR